ncbi:MAG: Pectate lyase superfamily protein [Verrucomicrobiota bacterium]|jgi:hypothetical protein
MIRLLLLQFLFAWTLFAAEQPGLSVRDCGAVGDGRADDSEAFAKAAERCLKEGRRLIVPAGDYLVTRKIVCFRWDRELGRRSLSISGEGPRASRIHFRPAAPDAVLFEHAEWFIVKDLAVDAVVEDKSAPSGIVFATPLSVQSALSSYENINIRGRFRIAWFNRFTMHDQWRNVSSNGPACHFLFATSASYLKPLETPKAGWNGGVEGWFHNLATFDGVLCNGGEVGIAGAVMQFNFVQLTTQGQAGGATNVVLPPGAPGTGLYLTGPEGKGGSLRGNSIGAFYAEQTPRPICLRNAGTLRASSIFLQGGADKPFPVAFDLEQSRVSVGSLTVRMPFTRLCQAKKGSLLVVELHDGPRPASDADGDSRVRLDTLGETGK